METLRYTVKLDKKDDEWHLLPLGDIHLGNPGHDAVAFKEAIDKIRLNKNYLTVGIGDYVENNNPDNERSLKTYDASMMLQTSYPELPDQVVEFVRAWQPIAHKTIGFAIGNHETRTIKQKLFRLLFCQPLNVTYLGERAYIALNFTYKNQLVHEYKLIVMHSNFGGQYDGTVQMAAMRAYNGYEDFDAVMFGHTHFCSVAKEHRHYLDTIGEKPQIITKKYYIINTGSFVKSQVDGYDAYSDKKFGTGIREVGTATLSFQPYNNSLYAHT